MNLRRGTSALLLLASASPALAQQLPRATPESVGLSGELLQIATDQLQDHIDAGDIAGVVAAVMRRGQLVYMESLGSLDLESGTDEFSKLARFIHDPGQTTSGLK